MCNAFIFRTKIWEEEEEEEDCYAEVRKILFRGTCVSGVIYLMSEARSTQNTGLSVERLQKMQRQNWKLENLPPQPLEGDQLCISSCLVTGSGSGGKGGESTGRGWCKEQLCTCAPALLSAKCRSDITVWSQAIP